MAAPVHEHSQAPLPGLVAGLEAALTASGLRGLKAEVRRLREAVAAVGEEAAEDLLPDLDQILKARTWERAGYYVRRLLRGVTEERTTGYNDLNLHRWQAHGDVWTNSLWLIDQRDRSGSHMGDYWGNYVPQIPNQLMRRYSQAGDLVLDPFLGSGTTLIECRRLGRHGVGAELKPGTAAAAWERIEAEPNAGAVETRVVTADAAAVDWPAELAGMGRESAQLVLMHPPYHDIIRFSDDPRDLSNAADEEAFLDGLEAVAAAATAVLERGRFAALVIGDKYAGGEWIPLGFHSMQRLQALGLELKSIIVKNFESTAGKRQQEELWRYRALAGGFYVFKHEYIFLFRKP